MRLTQQFYYRPTLPSTPCWVLFKGWDSLTFPLSFLQLRSSLEFGQRFGQQLLIMDLNSLNSQETAWVFSGNEISQICFIFALPFLSKIHKRTLWTSVAMMFAAFGLFLCASPFFAKVVFPDFFLLRHMTFESFLLDCKGKEIFKRGTRWI